MTDTPLSVQVKDAIRLASSEDDLQDRIGPFLNEIKSVASSQEREIFRGWYVKKLEELRGADRER